MGFIGAAEVALMADDMHFGGDRFSHLIVGDFGSQFDNFAIELVTGGDGRFEPVGRPFVPLVYM
jgi:hypothetical protein